MVSACLASGMDKVKDRVSERLKASRVNPVRTKGDENRTIGCSPG